ncbi:hypothetical protein [Luteimonas sp. 100069]|uniref:hypothetical protein n=1 Tax=Luteimonas sp. 100069 TaxID=2006109 RepID=UPI000F4DCA31|nr:hypothetical protein [Luteimonas sp. 100069]RPD86349.1 hypothetical protein EGK76_06650 [Luteimonas sp. 100069]
MSETPEVTTPAPKRRVEWNAVAAVIAALIGLLALVVSSYTALLQREQVRAEVWPYLQTVVMIDQGVLSVGVENKGAGPALVRGLRVYVDEQPQRTWADVFDALGLSDLRDTRASTLNGVVIARGESLQQVTLDNPADFPRLLGQYSRVRMAICYCSTLGDCWLMEPGRRTGQPHTEVDACPAPGPDEFLDNVLMRPETSVNQ